EMYHKVGVHYYCDDMVWVRRILVRSVDDFSLDSIYTYAIEDRMDMEPPEKMYEDLLRLRGMCVGISAKKEAYVNFLTDSSDERSTLRPADVLAFGWFGGKHACVDLTGVSPLVGLSGRGLTAGQAALKAASGKGKGRSKKCVVDIFIQEEVARLQVYEAAYALMERISLIDNAEMWIPLEDMLSDVVRPRVQGPLKLRTAIIEAAVKYFRYMDDALVPKLLEAVYRNFAQQDTEVVLSLGFIEDLVNGEAASSRNVFWSNPFLDATVNSIQFPLQGRNKNDTK
nr:auxilin-like protein [Tanacetum cinerariifolium]